MATGTVLADTALDLDRMSSSALMTAGNWDMVGKLCLAVSQLRGKQDQLAAKNDGLARRVAELENQVAALQSAARRQADSARQG